MRTLRRGLALLLHLLLLQATVLGGGVACAAHAAGEADARPGGAQGAHQGAHQGAPQAEHAAEHEAHGAASGERGAYEGGHAPGAPSDAALHCGLAAACLTPALASRAAPLALRAPAPARVRVAQDAAPRSASLAPEPPPPRG